MSERCVGMLFYVLFYHLPISFVIAHFFVGPVLKDDPEVFINDSDPVSDNIKKINYWVLDL